MKAEAAAKAGQADAASKTPVERSPHAKDVRLCSFAALQAGGVVGARWKRQRGVHLPPRAMRGCVASYPVPAPFPPSLPPARPSQSYDAAEFEALAEKYEKLNWRIIRWVLALSHEAKRLSTATGVVCAEPAPPTCISLLLPAASLAAPRSSRTTSTCCTGEEELLAAYTACLLPVRCS